MSQNPEMPLSHQLLADKTLRRHMLEIFSKDTMLEITKSDWLVLRNEYELYKFCRAWANSRVKQALGIKEPEPVLGAPVGKSC